MTNFVSVFPMVIENSYQLYTSGVFNFLDYNYKNVANVAQTYIW